MKHYVPDFYDLKTTPVRRWLIYFMGFRQHEGATTGLENLYFHVRRYYGDWPTEIRLYTWRDDIAAIADAIARQSATDAQVILTGYSFGGSAAVRLAGALAKRDRRVEALYLCDAVHRHKNPLKWWRSYFGRALLRIPANVAHVISCRQTRDFPRGGELHFQSTDTKHNELFKSSMIGHCWMDESRQFQKRHLDDLLKHIA